MGRLLDRGTDSAARWHPAAAARAGLSQAGGLGCRAAPGYLSAEA